MQLRVNFDAVIFNQAARAGKVAFALHALNLSKQFSEEFAQSRIVVDLHVSFAALFHEFDYFIRLTLLVSPMSDERAVAHVRLFQVVARLNADQLRHKSVHHIRIILRLVSICVGRESQLDQFGVS